MKSVIFRTLAIPVASPICVANFGLMMRLMA